MVHSLCIPVKLISKHKDTQQAKEQSYSCSFCPKTFSNNSHLIRHTKTHVPTDSFECALNVLVLVPWREHASDCALQKSDKNLCKVTSQKVFFGKCSKTNLSETLGEVRASPETPLRVSWAFIKILPSQLVGQPSNQLTADLRSYLEPWRLV